MQLRYSDSTIDKNIFFYLVPETAADLEHIGREFVQTLHRVSLTPDTVADIFLGATIDLGRRDDHHLNVISNWKLKTKPFSKSLRVALSVDGVSIETNNEDDYKVFRRVDTKMLGTGLIYKNGKSHSVVLASYNDIGMQAGVQSNIFSSPTQKETAWTKFFKNLTEEKDE